MSGTAETPQMPSEKRADEDPWKHRAEGMKCHSCMWYVAKADSPENELERGRCRRRAPTMNGYPVVFVNDWCGDHKLR